MKKALLVISFGTRHLFAHRQYLETCENALSAHCQGYDLFRAWTSPTMRKAILAQEGVTIDSPEQALDRLLAAGYQEVVIQPLQIMHGSEFEKIEQICQSYQTHFRRLRWGKPLLHHFADYQTVLAALPALVPALMQDERALFIGHGSHHPAFTAYACLDHMFMEQHQPYRMGVIEGYPTAEGIIRYFLAEKVRKVHIIPFLLVVGEHALRDIAGENGVSWRRRLERAGLETECHLQGLGAQPAIQRLFVQHLLHALTD